MTDELIVRRDVCIALENTLTIDGREVTGLTWDESVPIRALPDLNGESALLGFLDEIHREGNRILGTANLAAGYEGSSGLAITLSDVAWNIPNPDYPDTALRAYRGRIREVRLVSDPAWAECTL